MEETGSLILAVAVVLFWAAVGWKLNELAEYWRIQKNLKERYPFFADMVYFTGLSSDQVPSVAELYQDEVQETDARTPTFHNFIRRVLDDIDLVGDSDHSSPLYSVVHSDRISSDTRELLAVV